MTDMDVLATLPTVGLADLNTAAALQVRTDRKYVVPVGHLAAALTGVPGLRVLEIDGRRAARYETTYLDTTDLASWSASAHPRRRRWKVRTRVYADSGECWLEVKSRDRRGVTVKDRLPYDVARRHEVGADVADWVADRLVAAGARGVDPRGLVPTLHTGYRRATLLLPDGAGRATVDSGLAWTTASGRAAVGPVLVVETKSPPGGPGRLDRRLWSLGHRPVRISKYGTGLSLLTPGLPGNRWHRVTAGQLADGLTLSAGDAA